MMDKLKNLDEMERKRRVSGKDERTGDDACSGRRRNGMQLRLWCASNPENKPTACGTACGTTDPEETKRMWHRQWCIRS